jgi:hypothetical protein
VELFWLVIKHCFDDFCLKYYIKCLRVETTKDSYRAIDAGKVMKKWMPACEYVVKSRHPIYV